jgi:hypothetical protein
MFLTVCSCSALVHYHSHLNIARELKDSVGEACALCNLGKCARLCAISCLLVYLRSCQKDAAELSEYRSSLCHTEKSKILVSVEIFGMYVVDNLSFLQSR